MFKFSFKFTLTFTSVFLLEVITWVPCMPRPKLCARVAPGLCPLVGLGVKMGSRSD